MAVYGKPKSVRIAGLATALPPHRLPQETVTATVTELFGGRIEEFDRLSRVFGTSGVEERSSAVPMDWFRAPHGWRSKTEAYLQTAEDLLAEAARDALGKADIEPSDVAAVVCVSSTGIATPTLDARLVSRLGLPGDVQRLPIFGLGCAGGALGLARAAMLAEAMPGRPVLLLVVELCTLAFRHGDTDKSAIVASALFGDGAAALVLESGGQGDGPYVGLRGEHTWTDSLDIMGWSVEEDGLGVIFARSIPAFVHQELRPVAEKFLEEAGVAPSDLDGLVVHPGGPKVLDALADAFPECPGGLEEARDVLRAHGNMSAPTVIFVLEECLRSGRSGQHLLTALGPGFSAGFVLLDL